jgi:hypothetical protein
MDPDAKRRETSRICADACVHRGKASAGTGYSEEDRKGDPLAARGIRIGHGMVKSER